MTSKSILGTFVLGVTAGALLLAGCASRQSHTAPEGCAQFDESELVFEWAWRQYREADYRCGRAALLTVLEQLEAGGHPWTPERLVAVDTALTLGRLALLEERRGATAEASALWVRAQDAMRAAEHGDISLPELRTFVDRADAIGDRRRQAGGEAQSKP